MRVGKRGEKMLVRERFTEVKNGGS